MNKKLKISNKMISFSISRDNYVFLKEKSINISGLSRKLLHAEIEKMKKS